MCFLYQLPTDSSLGIFLRWLDGNGLTPIGPTVDSAKPDLFYLVVNPETTWTKTSDPYQCYVPLRMSYRYKT